MRSSVVVRRDARWQAMAHARGRICARAWRHGAGHVEAGGGARLGAEVPGRNHGRPDPRIPPTKPDAGRGADGGGIPRSVRTDYVEPEGLKSAQTVERASESAQGFARGTAGGQPWKNRARSSRFKATYPHGHEVATVNRALGVLRAAINWGRFQDPPLLSTTPFHRFGVSIKAREETKRDRRIHRDEEQKLLAAC